MGVVRIRRIPALLFGAFALVVTLSGAAQAVGKPHLVSTCVHDAALNYTLINNPQYVVALQRIIDSFGDARPIVFIECEAVEGLYAFRNDDDSSIPTHNYIIYSPSFVRLATQTNDTKLTFLLGHEYAHISLGHFTDQKNLSTYQKELQADRKGACGVARQNGDINSLIQILSGLRDATSETGYPSLADSEAAVRAGYDACRTGGQTEGVVIPRSRVALIQPASTTAESIARSIDWLSSESLDIDLDNIRNLKTRVPSDTAPVTRPSVGDIDNWWRGDDTLFLVLNDRTVRPEDADSSSDVSAPTFSGLFYIGPFAAGGRSAVVSVGLAESFTDDVADPARRNLLLTDKISAVALGYAALKYALETGQSREAVLQFAAMTDFALRDLRRHSGDVADFPSWTASLSRVDELLARIGS